MDSDLIAQEPTLRFCVLALAVALVAAWEVRAPRRSSGNLRARWRANFSIWLLDAVVLRFAPPVFAVGVAVVVAERGGGVLPMLGLPWWLAFVVSLLALDLSKYVEHWLCHRVPLLWRVHRVHHADTEYDFTVGFRFHPLEALGSAAMTTATIVVLGPPALAVLTHQVLTVATAVLVHGNVRMPAAVDDVLRRVIVTPDLHRVHHSAAMRESNSNLGSVLPLWDRLFGTYVDQPAAGHDGMRFGLGGPVDPRHVKLGWMLLDPFLSSEGSTSRRSLVPNRSRCVLFVVFTALMLSMLVPPTAHAELTVNGFTNGCFGDPCTPPSDSGPQTATFLGLHFANATFAGTTVSGILVLDDPGETLGTLSAFVDRPTTVYAGKFNLLTTFTVPGTTPSAGTFNAVFAGTIISQPDSPTGSVTFNFDNTPQSFAVSNGVFTLAVLDVTVVGNGDAPIVGNIVFTESAPGSVPVPEPTTLGLLVSGIGIAGALTARRRRQRR